MPAQQQITDLYYALLAINRQRGIAEDSACEKATEMSYAVYRGLITFDSVLNMIVAQARQFFIVTVQKGNGDVQ